MDDENVVLIDPGQAAVDRYADIKLPCDQEQRINNTLQAPQRNSPEKSKKANRAAQQNHLNGVNKPSDFASGRVVNQTLR